MKRLKVKAEKVNYDQFFDNTENDNAVQLNPLPFSKKDVIEAQIQEGDTLQAICLRYNCSLSEIKRLNKIEKEIEIHARSTIRIPVAPHTVLLDTLPRVHTSGSSSPKHSAGPPLSGDQSKSLNENPLLNEKLIIASVSNPTSSSINDIILNTKITPSVVEYHDEDGVGSTNVPLLGDYGDERMPQPRPIPIRHKFEVSFNGTDCDMSWVCLFICILLLCVAIPLIYVFWTVEHLDHHHEEEIRPSIISAAHDKNHI